MNATTISIDLGNNESLARGVFANSERNNTCENRRRRMTRAGISILPIGQCIHRDPEMQSATRVTMRHSKGAVIATVPLTADDTAARICELLTEWRLANQTIDSRRKRAEWIAHKLKNK